MCQHYFLWDVNKLPFTVQREIADDTIFTDNVRKGNFQNLLGIYSDLPKNGERKRDPVLGQGFCHYQVWKTVCRGIIIICVSMVSL